MRPIDESPAGYDELSAKARAVLPEILSRVTASRTAITIPSNSTLDSSLLAKKFYVLREGVLTYSNNGRKLLLFEEGDLVCLSYVCGCDSGTIYSDFAVIADEYDYPTFLRELATNSELLENWNTFISYQLSLFVLLVNALSVGESEFNPEMRRFNKGDVIIAEGTMGDEVFTLIEGKADVLHSNVKVGEVLQDEVFGVIGALTNTHRIATVVATQDSLALALHKNKFLDLMTSRPKTVLKLVEDMARTLSSLNQRVVDLSKPNL